jgi:hypothetical protein
MNWNAVGAIGQILGSLAVFVTIGFLAVQVHDNETQMQRSIAESRTQRVTQANATLATNGRLAGIHVKVNQALRGDKPSPPFIEAAKRFGLTDEEAVMLYTDLLIRWQVTAQTIPYPTAAARFGSAALERWRGTLPIDGRPPFANPPVCSARPMTLQQDGRGAAIDPDFDRGLRLCP